MSTPPRFRHLSLAAVLASAVLALGLRAQEKAGSVPDEDAGAEVYEAVCKGCHGVSIAPTLRGVVGRGIASVESYKGYSEGLKAKSSLEWTRENLDAFLQAPGEFAPGTLMTETIAEAQRRADLIAFLATLPPPRE